MGSQTIIIVGASAGGVAAFQGLIREMGKCIECPLVFVQHLPQQQESSLAEVLSYWSQIPVVEVEDKMAILPGINVAPAGYHTSISPEGCFALDVDELVRYSRPSIDVLFESAARYWPGRVVGILLSGANEDGSQGLKAILERGGTTIVLDPEEAESPRMPTAAIEARAALDVMKLKDIAAFVKAQQMT